MDNVLQLLNNIESYGFHCIAGNLKNCVEWEALKTTIAEIAKVSPIYVGAACRVEYDGIMRNAFVTAVNGNKYDAIQLGTGIQHTDIPNELWRPNHIQTPPPIL